MLRYGLLAGLMALLVTHAALAEPVTVKLTVKGVERKALVYPGKAAGTEAAPVVLVFHGLTGTSGWAAKATKIHEAWPEATVAYPQGLSIYSARLKKKVPAWQPAPGRDGDRDVLFTDALLDKLAAAHKVDARRVYATGISNGALFTYVLLVARPQRFAAFAPVAGAAASVRRATIPRPVLIIQGKTDPVVKLAWAEGTRDALRALNGCGTDTAEWAPGYLSYQPCASGQPVIWHAHDGGHIWPSDASAHIVRFFKEQALPE